MIQREKSANRYLSIREVADMLSVSISTVKSIINEGRIKAVCVSNRCIRISEDDVKKFIEENKI